MCLIAGGMGKNLKIKLATMINSGKHRGSDSFGVWTNEGVLKSEDFSQINEIPDGKIGLLQCRLAMTGSKRFTQPFYNEFILVHNGEIYNYYQIRAFLENRGIEFESDVDTEVILRLLESLIEKNIPIPQAVKKIMTSLNGDYAVAFSDKKDIYLFRDPIGVRPLYYSPNGFFASEKKVLWSIGENAIPVKPGELVRISNGKIEQFKLLNVLDMKGSFFDYSNSKMSITKSLDYAIRLRGSRKIGILFSGGLDSSLITILASKYSKKITLYTAGAEGSPDLEWSRKVSEELGLKLKEYVFDLDDVRDAVPSVMFAIEEPNAMNLAIGIPLYFATKLASEDGTKILLSGQGADELFGGYAKYLTNPRIMEQDLIEMGEKNLARDDKIAMLNSVEGRFPFLDINMVKSALRVPLKYKIHNGTRKAILREVALELGLPKEVAYREKKACQYGTNAQKLLEKIAKKEGLKLSKFSEKVFNEVFEQK
ncbi:asparagine synthase (glutamine-hydrolyzing) [Thermococcus sp. MV5]|uniref:asparagine synthase (glutamine-hydrolyzing) n=1 Tax=Thermococcus sp. MV5 TaxID=1638272 RepID=UPI00143A2392|nr:asparagine synthase (glutamine-hydrolyzing) [Thermococcus sp. MV5]NJE27016.1 asparagine synthase (glutamine-hydrolyzing) [Thermococcus sp. MV5]